MVERQLPKLNVRVRFPLPAARRNGLRSIQNPQPNGWGFLIPLRHSSSPQKVTLGSPVRLQWLVKPPRPSRRLAVATNFLRICALRRWRFILSHPYNKKSIVRVSVRCSFFIPSARELESFRFRMPTGGPTKGRGLLHNV